MKEDATTSELRQHFAASKRILDLLSKVVKQAAPLSQSGDWQFSEQLVNGWVAFIRHVMFSTIGGRKADAKLSNQVCAIYLE